MTATQSPSAKPDTEDYLIEKRERKEKGRDWYLRKFERHCYRKGQSGTADADRHAENERERTTRKKGKKICWEGGKDAKFEPSRKERASFRGRAGASQRPTAARNFRGKKKNVSSKKGPKRTIFKDRKG